MTVDKASARIRGKPGTTVRLTLRRGATYEYELTFTRATIELPAVKYDLIEERGTKIGYLRIVEWIPQTRQRVQEALDNLSARGAVCLIVDVRSNPGGLLSSVVEVSDLFLKEGLIVSTRGRNPKEDEEFKASADLAWPMQKRMIVLINKGSASASEIFAGAMKDTKRALLIGEKTYGKGSVQQVFPLDQTGFKLTMARYYTPSGINIDKTGIEPDLVSADFEFDDKKLETLQKLYDSGKIEDWAAAHPRADTAARNAFAAQLAAQGYDLPPAYLRKLVRDELNRMKDPPVVDREFDLQLIKAIDVIGDVDFDRLLQDAKTLGERAKAASAVAGVGISAIGGTSPTAPAAQAAQPAPTVPAAPGPR